MRDWCSTIFSYANLFNLDGPDGAVSFWADKHLPKATFSKRTSGRARVMVLAATSWKGKTPLVFVDNKLNAALYVQMLQARLEPLM